MSDHLPECVDAMIPDFHNERWVCICDALRACEQRVAPAAYDKGLHDMAERDLGIKSALLERMGYAADLDAAREAVADALGPHSPGGSIALAAIDALRANNP